MLIHSKELLLSGGKKQPEMYFQKGTYYNAITIGYPKTGDNCFVIPSFGYSLAGTLKSINGNNITWYNPSLGTVTCSFSHSVTIDNFVFNSYYYGLLNYIPHAVFLSPKQEVGDTVYLYELIFTSSRTPYITSVGASSFVVNSGTGTQTIPITNTPVTDYIYRA